MSSVQLSGVAGRRRRGVRRWPEPPLLDKATSPPCFAVAVLTHPPPSQCRALPTTAPSPSSGAFLPFILPAFPLFLISFHFNSPEGRLYQVGKSTASRRAPRSISLGAWGIPSA